MKTYHILNGDALLERFPEDIKGEVIVCRECLIDGPLTGRNLTKFYQNRMAFLADNYGEDSYDLYLGAVMPSFDEMMNIEGGSQVYFWFEADLFCQVNFWFCASLMDTGSRSQFHLVIPEGEARFGFSGVNNSGLVRLYENATGLSAMTMAVIQQLWKAHKADDKKAALTSSAMLEMSIPQLAGLKQTLEDFYNDAHLRLIEQLLSKQMNPDFGKFFQEFCKEAPQYGFGDLQLMRYYKELI